MQSIQRSRSVTNLEVSLQHPLDSQLTQTPLAASSAPQLRFHSPQPFALAETREREHVQLALMSPYARGADLGARAKKVQDP